MSADGGTLADSADGTAESADPTLSGGEGLDGRSARDRSRNTNQGAPGKFGLRAWGRWFWRQLTSMRVALILLFLLALASVPGSLFPQRGTNPIAVDEYIANHPALAPWLDRLSMFDVFAAPWFAAIYLLLCISLAGCIIPRTFDQLRALRRKPPAAPARLDRMQGLQQLTVGAEPDAVAEAAARWLRKQHWRVRSSDSPADAWVSAEKGYWRETGNLVFHVCLLILLAGLGVGSMFGWRGTVIVREGQGFSNTLTQYDTFSSGRLVDRSALPPFTLEVQDFTASFQRGGQQDGAPRDYAADVGFQTEPGAPEQQGRIEVNSPLSIDGARVYLLGHGYAPHVIVRDASGKVTFDESVVFLPRDGKFTSTGVVKVPDSEPQIGLQGIFLPTAIVDPVHGPISTFPAPDDPALFLSAWRGDLGLDSGRSQSVFRLDTSNMTKIGLESLRPGQVWQLPGGAGSVEFVGAEEWVSLTVASDPGKGLALVAALGAIGGLMLSLFVRRRRVWLRATPDRQGRTLVSVAGLSRTENAAVGQDTAELADVIRAEPDGPEGGT